MNILKTAIAASAALILTSPVGAQMITKTSPHSVETTIDRLEAAVTGGCHCVCPY